MFSHNLILLLLVVYTASNDIDLTTIPEEKSLLAIKKVKEWCVLDYDFYYLTRLAVVQKNVFPDQRAGGLFKVTDEILSKVKEFCKNSKCKDIENKLQTTIADVNMTQLDKPIYSAAIMALYISSLGPIPGSLQGQAKRWVKDINPTGNTLVFTNWVYRFNLDYDCEKPMDILLILDVSKGYDSNIAKNFFSNVPHKSRISMITYGSYADVDFKFTDYLSGSQHNLQNIHSKLGLYDLSKAIVYANNKIFKETNNNIKVAVIMSRQKVTDIATVEYTTTFLKNKGVVIYTDIKEKFKSDFENIRSKPSCQHYIADETERDFSDFGKVLESKYCKLPFEVVPCDYTSIKAIRNYLQADIKILNVNCSVNGQGFNVEINVKCGEVKMYVAVNNTYPTEGKHMYKDIATVNQAGSIYIEEVSPHDNYYITLIAKRVHCIESHYTISLKPIPPPEVVSCGDTIIKPITDYIQEDIRILKVNCRDNKQGFNVEINVKCGEVTTYVTVNNTYPSKGKHEFKVVTSVNQAGSINIEEFYPHDIYYIKLIARREHCTDSKYTISIQPIPPPQILSCGDKIITPISNNTQENVKILAANCNKIHREFNVKIYVKCGEVTIYEAVNNTYPSEGKHDKKVVATIYQAGSINIEQFSPYDQHYIKLKARRKYCSDSHYSIFLLPIFSGATAWFNPQYGILCLVNLIIIML